MRRIAPECARIAPEEELRSAPFVAEEFERCLLLGSESQHERQHGGHRPTRTTAVRGVADAEEEAKLIDDLVDMLIERGAIRDPSMMSDLDDHYQEALDYIMQAVVPTLKDLASQGAYERK